MDAGIGGSEGAWTVIPRGAGTRGLRMTGRIDGFPRVEG